MILECITFSLSNIDWTAIGAIITALMMIATYITVHQNKNQVDELKKQWKEENRPRLFFTIEIFNKCYALRIANEGNYPAHNINIDICESFISRLREPYNWIFERISNRPFSIAPHSQKYFILDSSSSYINNKWKDEKFDIEIKGSYNNQYNVDLKLPIQEYIGKVEFLPYAPIEQSLEYLAMDTYSEDGKEKRESLISVLQSIRDIIKENINGTKQDK